LGAGRLTAQVWFLKIGFVPTMALVLFFACGLIGIIKVRKKFNRYRVGSSLKVM